MSSKRSDNSASTVPDPANRTAAQAPGGSPVPSGPPGRGTLVTPARGGSAVVRSLLSNLPLPILLAVIIVIGMFIEDPDYFSRYYLRIVFLVGFNIILAVGLQLINGFSGQFSLGHAGFMAVGAYLAAYPAKEHAALTAASASARLIDDPFGVLVFYVSLGVALVLGGVLLYAALRAVGESRRIHTGLPAILMLVGLGWIVWDLALKSKYATPPAYLVWTRAVNALVGLFEWTFAALAPAGVWLSEALPEFARQPACFVVLILGGGAFAAATGFVVGLPTLRLRGDYLAIATLGLAEIIRIAIQNSTPLGGPLGLTGIPRYTNFAWLYGIAIVAIFAVWRLAYSAKGRLIQAVREDEIASSAIGVSPTSQKVLSFVFGAFIGGMAGALFAMNENSITPSYFGLQKSIEIVVIVTLGGLGSISGAILAAIVLTLLPELLRPIAEYRMIIYSLLLIVMMLIRPRGLLGGIELWPGRMHTAGKIQRGFSVVFAGKEPATSPAVAAEPAPQFHGGDIIETLEAKGVWRRFGGLTAVSDFSLRIGTGDLHGLIGPNGAGKTTAFNVITGVYAPSEGEVWLGDRRIDGLSPVWINRHGVARTFQNIRLFKSLTVLDNVAAAIHNRYELSVWRTLLRTPRFFRERDKSEAQAMSLLETMNLSHLADHTADSLSYGDQRRLEMARALATDPSILLLDEPAAGMNPQEKSELMELIRFIRRQFKVGILLIEHDMKLVMNVCEKIAVLDHGETIAVGTPAEIQANPKVIEAYLGEPGT